MRHLSSNFLIPMASNSPTIPIASIPAIICVMSFTLCPAMMIQPTPSVAQTISAASIVIQELDRATCAPEKMEGTAAGTTISKNSCDLEAPQHSCRADQLLVHVARAGESVERERNEGGDEDQEVLVLSPMPNHRMASGIHASGAMGRRRLKIGIMTART